MRFLWRVYYRWIYCPVFRPLREALFFPILNHLPRFAKLERIRAFLLALSGARVGRNVKIGGRISLTPAGGVHLLTIGNNTFINDEVRFECLGSGISLGNNVLIGPRVSFEMANHQLESIPRHLLSMDILAVSVEDDVWIGSGTIILPGVTIGRGAVVAAGSVVTKNVAPGTLVAGVPAAFKKRLLCDA